MENKFTINDLIEMLESKTGIKVQLTQLAEIIGKTKQFIGQYKDKELPLEHSEKLMLYFSKFMPLYNGINDDCIDIPIRYDVHVSLGHGTTIYNENQTGTYKVGRKLVRDIGASEKHIEMIFAQGDSMLPDIKSGDALIVDFSKKEVYDGKVYCVRIEGELLAKRLQKIPPTTIKVISDNDKKYDAFYIDFSKKIDFDFEIIGQVCWSGRVLK